MLGLVAWVGMWFGAAFLSWEALGGTVFGFYLAFLHPSSLERAPARVDLSPSEYAIEEWLEAVEQLAEEEALVLDDTTLVMRRLRERNHP